MCVYSMFILVAANRVGYFELTSRALLLAHMYFQKKPAMKLKVAMMLGERQVNDSGVVKFPMM